MTHLPPLPVAAPGRYRHYKGGDYELIAVARHSETHEALVIYRALDDVSAVWARPFAMFFGTVEVRGQVQPRFQRIADNG